MILSDDCDLPVSTDESGSDSEGAESTSSSYSSLSDFVSEMVSSDLSPSEFCTALFCCHIYFLWFLKLSWNIEVFNREPSLRSITNI